MKIYLDACALNRLTDDQGQARIRAEAKAIEQIFYWIWQNRVDWCAGRPLLIEVLRNPDGEKRADALSLIHRASALANPLGQTL